MTLQGCIKQVGSPLSHLQQQAIEAAELISELANCLHQLFTACLGFLESDVLAPSTQRMLKACFGVSLL